MIEYYSGTPGSGKSLHVASKIYYRLNRSNKPQVIANFMINTKMIKNDKAVFIYKDNEELTVPYLLEFALQNHKLGEENQTLIVVDECAIIWNAREWQSQHNRMDWLKFFTQHRKLGYNMIVISQNDRQIDRQIRSQFEYEVKHRKVNNFKYGKFLPFATFVAVTVWYGINEKISAEFFTYKKKWGKFYDSYATFEMDTKFMGLIEKNQEGSTGVPSGSSLLDDNLIIPKKKRQSKIWNRIKSILT